MERVSLLHEKVDEALIFVKQLITTVWKEVIEQCVNRIWRNLRPGCMKDVIAGIGFNRIVPNVNKETLNKPQEVGFVNLTSEDTEEVLAQILDEYKDQGLPERMFTTKCLLVYSIPPHRRNITYHSRRRS